MSRIPPLPDRDSLPPDEQEMFDNILELPEREKTNPLKVKAYGKQHPKGTSGYPAMRASPAIYAAWRGVAPAFIRGQAAGRFTSTDHDIIDLVLSFDSGHLGLLLQHTFFYVAGGGRIGLIDALRLGNEEELTEEESRLVSFIRQVAAGGVTDESWEWMKARLDGDERGLLEYIFMILYLVVHVRLMQAYQIPTCTLDEYAEVLDELRKGTWQPMPDVEAYAEYASARSEVMGF